jgi:hypothetical protein
MRPSALHNRRPQAEARLVCRFAHQLTIRSGVTVGARRSMSGPSRWQIVWYDGPTVITMRLHAADLGPAIVGIELDQLIWRRTIRTPCQASSVSGPAQMPEAIT